MSLKLLLTLSGGLLLWGAGIAHAALGALFVSAIVASRR